MSPSQGRSLSRSLITRGGNEAEGQSPPFAAVSSVSNPLGDTIECEAYENDRRTPPPRSNWSVNAWLDRLHLLPSARRDESTVDLESKFNAARRYHHCSHGPYWLGEDHIRGPRSWQTRRFDDTFVSDAQIFGRIAHWLNAVYRKNIKLNGILYFHPISDNKVRDASSRTFNVLKELCGKDNCKNVIFVTTMWNKVPEEVGLAREQELQSDFWRVMISLGSTTQRFEGTTESAWEIINSISISQPAERRPLQIQREMGDEHILLHRTAAGKTLFESLTSSLSGSKGNFKRFKRGTKKTNPQPTYSTSITVTLTDIPTDNSSTGTGIIILSSSGFCSVEGYRNVLAQVIPALQAAVNAAELAHMHYLKDAITLCLSIALSIETMAGTPHHAFSQVLETATLLINMVVEVAKETTLSADIQAAVTEFAKEMNRMQEILQNFAQRTPEARRILRSTDVHIMSSCANSMRVVCDVLRSTSSIKHDLRSVDDGLGAVKRSLEIDNCSCGIPINPEQALSS
ncbi:hypothetical protein EDC04DRAFT_462217 [Pisolithus marmoratus]|nr:hypothetical protein EDC04DRAFT_462217 [Pisolithus marmoratus]